MPAVMIAWTSVPARGQGGHPRTAALSFTLQSVNAQLRTSSCTQT
jgi:hypothetical protein